MLDKLNIPDEFQTSFRRLVRIMPDAFREDEEKLHTLLVYLKLGGLKLARQRVDLAKKSFQKEFVLFKRIPAAVDPEEETRAADSETEEVSAEKPGSESSE
jgi:hypothetical protein